MRSAPILLLYVLATACPEFIEAETNATKGLMETTSDDTTGGSTADVSTTMDTISTSASTTSTSTSASGSTSTSATGTTSTTGPGCSAPCDPLNPPEGLSCTDDCEYDFSEVPQWYCTGICTPIGETLGGTTCDQPDADMFCKLRTGNPRATASVWWESTITQDDAGFCCLDTAPELSLGPIPLHGLSDLCYVSEHMSELPMHATGSVIVAEGLDCMVP